MTENFDSTAELGRLAPGYSPLEWTDERVAAMWAFYAATEKDSYFSGRFGKALLDQVRARVPASGKIADYGCGRGQIARQLANARDVLAVDFEETLAETRADFKANPTAHPVEFATPEDISAHASSVSTLYFLETIEHLLPAWIEPTFENIRTLLKPGGIIVCSTPNEENVAKAMVCCPQTRTYFHKYQHMRVFSADSLSAFMDEQGFDPIEVKAHNLGMTSPYARLKQMARYAAGRSQTPHLVYIGRKR